MDLDKISALRDIVVLVFAKSLFESNLIHAKLGALS